MTFKEFYDSVDNPISDVQNIKKVLDLFGNNKPLYYSIIYANGSDTVNFEDDVKDNQDMIDFRIDFFNRWISKLSNLTESQCHYIFDSPKDEYLIELIDKVKKLPVIDNYEDYLDAKRKLVLPLGSDYGRFVRHLIEDAVTGVFVWSEAMDLTSPSLGKIDHRLYLNVANIEDGHKIVSYLVDRCESDDIPYEIKFWCNPGRSDQIVIYAPNDLFFKYLDYLKDFKKENLDVVSRIGKPPVFTGVYDGYIGYGSEPEKLPNGPKRSYNSLREKILYSALENEGIDWFNKNRDKVISYKGERMTAYECLVKCLVDYYWKSYTDSSRPYEKYKETIYKQIDGKLKDYLDGKLGGSFEIELLDKNGHSYLATSISNEELLPFLTLICKDNNQFISNIQEGMKREARETNIDEKFCFDNVALEKMHDYDSKHNDELYEETTEMVDDSVLEENLSESDDTKKEEVSELDDSIAFPSQEIIYDEDISLLLKELESLDEQIRALEEEVNSLQMELDEVERENEVTSDKIDKDLDDFEIAENIILSMDGLSEEHRRLMMETLYESFDDYVLENPEYRKGR